MKRKGISPIIATVLLVAFAIAVGGIFSLWITGFSKSQATQVSASSSDQVSCNSALSITTNNGGAVSGGIVNVRVSYDYGSRTLYMPNATVICGTTSASASLGTSLVPAQINTTYVTNAACISLSSISLVRVAAVCMGPSSGQNFTVSGECKIGGGCIS